MPPDATARESAAGLRVVAPDPGPLRRRGRWRRRAGSVLPPVAVLVLMVLTWQVLWVLAIWPEHTVPAPAAVWQVVWEHAQNGQALRMTWTSVHRAVLGFAMAIALATPLGLAIAKVPVIRAAIGPLLAGLQNLPSVAWVPAAVLWVGPTDWTIYTVMLLGSVPSMANSLVSSIDHVPPILPRVGAALGAGRWNNASRVLLPAALPGYLTGLKQGWAFSWRSLMAAELITASPASGFGLGAFLDLGQTQSDMPTVMTAMVLILLAGVGIDIAVFRPVERAVLTARGLHPPLRRGPAIQRPRVRWRTRPGRCGSTRRSPAMEPHEPYDGRPAR